MSTYLALITSRYYRHAVPVSPRGHAIAADERHAFFLLLRVWTTAVFRLVIALDRRFAPRYLKFLEDLNREYRIRCVDSPTTADHWLLCQVDRMALPDLRQHKSLLDDLTLVRHFDALREAFQPFFRAQALNAASRSRLAEVASALIGRTFRAEDLPIPGTSTLTDYCLQVLHTNAVRLSRARARIRRYDRAEIRNLGREIRAMMTNFKGSHPVPLTRPHKRNPSRGASGRES